MEKWSRFSYASGSNPYIAKTEKEKNRLLKKYNCLFIEEEENDYFILDNLLDNNDNIIDFVDEELSLYVNDEAGESMKEEYDNMAYIQKINLFYNALNMSDRIRDNYDFRTDLVINFDYGNY